MLNKKHLESIDNEIITELNTMLSQEHACSIRYATHAAMVSGPYSETVSARLQEIADDELEHCKKLRERILALHGKPTMEVETKDLTSATSLEEILKINIIHIFFLL